MSRLLILGANQLPKGGSSTYRGTYRRSPDFQKQFHPDHPINRAFTQFCERGGQSLVIAEIDFARGFAKLYRDLTPPQNFDVVEVVGVGESPRYSTDLLGYDISKGGIGSSMLCWGLELMQYSSEAGRIYQPLIRLIEESCKPRLNRHGLFDDPQTAHFCLECMLAINHSVPSYFESDLDQYEVTGLYLVPLEGNQ